MRKLLALALILGCRPPGGGFAPPDATTDLAADAGADSGGKEISADRGMPDRAAPDLAGADRQQDQAPPPQPLDGPADGRPSSDPLAGTLMAVVVGYGGRRVSSTDGVTWENFQQLNPNGGDDADLLRGVAFGGGTFVAVGGSTFTSPDGVVWTNRGRSPRNGNFVSQAVWVDGQFVAAGGNGLRVRSVDLGVTWQDDAGYQDIHYRDIASANGAVVATGHTYAGVGIVAVSRDGVHWTEAWRGGSTLNRVAFGNGVFVALGEIGHCLRSADGTNWTETTLAGDRGASLLFAGTEFIAGVGGMVYRSSDGATWTPAPTARPAAAWFNGRYLSFGWPATIDVSTNLMQWTHAFAPGGSGFSRLAQGRVAR